MSRMSLQAAMVAATVVSFLGFNAVNEALFARYEFADGINWVFLPAGLRLLATLLFAEAGFVGLLLSGIVLNVFHFAFADPVRALGGALAGALGPYLVYYYAAQRHGFAGSLRALTPGLLLWLTLLCSLASPLLHHLLFLAQGQTGGLLRSYAAMAVGDLCGTLLVLYGIKAVLALMPRPA